MPAPRPSSLRPEALLRQARTALEAGRTAEGERLCRRVLAAAPGQLDALRLLAQLEIRRGRPDRAEALLREGVRLAPGRAEPRVELARLLRATDRLPEAEAALYEALERDPTSVEAWHALGLLLHGRGADAAETRRAARTVTKLAPRFAGGWELLAAVEQRRGELDAAVTACREGLKHQPDAARLRWSLAQLLRQQCAFADAAVEYEAARVAGFEDPELYRNRAEALLEAGDPSAALACADEGIRLHPQNPELQAVRVRLHRETGAPGDPVARLAATVAARPRDPALRHTLAQLLLRLEREIEASEVLAEGRSAGCPDTPGLALLDARLASRRGDPRAAQTRFEALLEAVPAFPAARLAFAEHLLGHGDPLRAEALCAEVLEAHPHDQIAWACRGTAWQLLGDPREAWLLDYERMVLPVPVPVPDGYRDRADFFASVQEVLETLHRTKAHPIEQSVRGGTQTNGFLFRLPHPLLQVLEAQLREAIASVLASFPDEREHPFWGRRPRRPLGDGLRFAGAWSVRLRDQGFHTNHVHDQGWVSSALYVALPEEIRAADDEAGHIRFGVPMAELGLDLPPRRVVRPEVGTLVLFPSYMWHGTVPFRSAQPRITVAFDLLPAERPPGA